jgi:hypothetical protein
MAWTDFFVKELPNAKTVVAPDGRPFVSMEIAYKEYVEVHMTTGEAELPFKVIFKHFNQFGEVLEDREYAQAGSKVLAAKFAMDLTTFRLNSFEIVYDGY